MDNDSVFASITVEEIMKRAETPQSLSAMEQTVRQVMQKVGNLLLHLWLLWLTPRYPASSVRCPHCGEQATYQRQRWGQLLTLFGTVRYRRAYYACSRCHQGHYPLDAQLGLRPNALSAEVERLAGMTGVQMPFGKGRDIFEALTLVALSDQSMDKATQAYGVSAEIQEQAWIEEACNGPALLQREREKPRPVRLYGSLDGGHVPIRAANGEEQPWRELKVGAWFVARGQPPKHPHGQWHIQAQDITYYADIAPADDFGKLLWASGVQRDAHRALELIFLGDGAHWIWDLVSLHFPNAVQIVDWFHACEYLTPIAKAAFPNSQHQNQWVERVKTDLWQGRLEAVIAACAALMNPQRPDDPAQKAVTYFSNNRQRMDYPTYRAQGYQIGSGTIESGVKQIATQRLKVPGARWNIQSACRVAKARAAFLSGQWPALAAQRTHLPKCA